MRVISLNTWAGYLQEPLWEFLSRSKPDVLCLQEVHNTPEFPRQRVVDHNWDGVVRVNLFRELQHLLPGYAASHHPFARHWLNDGETHELPVRYGIATFVSRRLRVVGERTQFIYGKFRDGPGGNHPLPRNIHLARINDPVTDRDYVVGHFHGLWLRSGRKDTRLHRKQAANILAALRVFVREGDRLVLCGDMNLLPESGTLRLLRDEFSLRELVTEFGFPGTRTDMIREEVKDAYADYMLVSENIQVRTFDVPKRPEISDHCPLVLDCE